MISKAFSLTALAVSAAALVAACGGGGGSEAAATPSVQLSGVAATGLALANSAVDVKCASGTGTATTNGNGAYTVTVENGALPCIVKVTGTANGVPVTLHSIAQGGTASGSTTTATANVTPLTEMILARAAGTLPSDLFTNFGTGSAVPAATLTQATTDVLTALGTAAGVDLSAIADPFQASLVAATETNLSGGNAYDQLLDQLGAVVSPASLPQVVSQIASTTGSTAPVSLNEVVANVSKGTLANCPTALSGKYRVVDYTGGLATVDLDFGTMKLTPEGETTSLTMVANSGQNCEVSVNDADAGVTTTVVFGPSGAGAIRDAERIGYIFPVQSHRMTAITGEWEFMESGIAENNLGEHFIGKMTIAADGTATVCDYNVMAPTPDFTTCNVDTDESAAFQEHEGGSFVLNYGSGASPVFAFRAPSGDLTLFGTNNPEHLTAPGSFRTSFVMTRPKAWPLPTVGSTSRYWDFTQRYFAASGNPPTTNGVLSVVPSAESITNTEVTATTITRVRPSDGRIDTWQVDKPIPGLRYRPAGTDNNGQPLSALYQRVIPGTGMVIYVDAMSANHFAGVVVPRP